MIHDASLPERVASYLSDDALAIFLVHGVIERQRHRVRNYTGKHLDSALFTRCMGRLAESGTPISMDEVLRCCESGKAFPPRSFALTFDDGFENNLSIAAPILAGFGIPATIYVTSSFIDQNGMSWIDRIERAVENAPSQTLNLDWANEQYTLSDPDSRIAFLKAVRHYVKNDPNCDANSFADAVCEHLGKSFTIDGDDALDRKMTWQEIRSASSSSLVNFGGHSHTHPILSFLTPARLSEELDTSLKLLFDKGGIGPTHYSYPEGLEHCFSDEVIAQLKMRGVRCCPTAIEGVNRQGSDPFHLRRIMIA